ncbi:sialate O-acetylesterase [Dyadobacter fanqingshengii]|uniref:Sialate O-acetylesterase n=1 Tax=Dyadobacter fanqingshengii TaxID=2906443 RepID=A0A9X1P8V3_9BACT|nr:sialate O-acetylesterase [Dyadobacter fanqingshengii]MCF0039809.1 sialate O-acetylesterase [Dyadobacter fanqingshengii]USJ38428.1 sialate O-acetylesterase [Dyadobacter fanqingshengii]
MMVRMLFLLLLNVLAFDFSKAQYALDSTLTLAPIFSDHMVLQRSKPIRIYGKAASGSNVNVQFLNKALTTKADQSGKWNVVFPASKEGGPYAISVSANDQKITVSDVLIGDVWLCSGQSNMEFALQDAQTGPEELRAEKFDSKMRLLKMEGIVSTGDVAWDSASLSKVNRYEYFSSSWQTFNKASAASFSAVAYYFGKKIKQEASVPIGLIQVAVGGSPTESWIEHSLLEQNQQFAGMLGNWPHSTLVMDWCRERAAKNISNAQSADQKHPYQPGYNFQSGIAPLTDFPITGVIWYQGESNVFNVPLHAQLFEMLVKSWRQKWGYAFPFYYVQLSGIERANWPEFRDSQRLMLAKIPNSGMAVSYDLGDSLNVHPIRKKEVGERLALLALRNTYKKNAVANGPVPARAMLKDRVIRIQFAENEKLSTQGSKPLIGFEMITQDGKRMPANASIQGNEVVLNIPKDGLITTIMYAYQPFTRANLYNEAGLPAPTFSMKVK